MYLERIKTATKSNSVEEIVVKYLMISLLSVISTPNSVAGLRVAADTRRRSVGVVRASVAAPPAVAAAAAKTHYEVLGLLAGASKGEIKEAYRRLARELHPDAGADAGEFIRLHAAYATLADPERRAEYDQAMARPPLRWAAAQRASAGVPFTGAGAARRRTWETDQCW